MTQNIEDKDPYGTIVYLSHGSKKFYDQTRFSVLTLLYLLESANRNDINIVVYTDNIESVPKHEKITCIEIPRRELKSYRGKFDYVHRIKLCTLLRACKEISGPFLYVDCDTRWISLPDHAFGKLRETAPNGKKYLVMHANEGKYSESFFPVYYEYIRKHKAELASLGIENISNLYNWNAGAIGVPQNSQAFFETALRVCDHLFTKVKPRNWVEQCAVSLVGCSQYEMFALGDCLHHYWNHGYEAPIYLARFFSELPSGLTVEEMAHACATHQWDDSELKRLQAMPIHIRKRTHLKWKNSISKRVIDLKILLDKIA